MRRHRIAPHPTYAVVSLGAATLDRTAFADRTGRLGGALGTTVVTHAVILLVVWGLARMAPAVQPPPVVSTPGIARFVFAGLAGKSGGGGGGGDRSPQPAALMRTRPGDATAVRVAPPAALATPDQIVQEAPPEPDAWRLPVQPSDAGAQLQAGASNAPDAPPNDARGPGQGGGTDRGKGPGSGPGEGPGQGPGMRGGVGDGTYRIGDGVTAPRIVYQASPQYTPEAMRAKVQGVALLSGIVAIDGTLHDIRIARSLDGTFGLDQEAIACVRQWRFRPGTRQGQPVPVSVTIEVAFNLR
ncbi:MAG: TonB family protein [Vicinamibacteraceae bacterium]